MCIYKSVYVCICLYVSMCNYMCVCVSVCTCEYMYLRVLRPKASDPWYWSYK